MSDLNEMWAALERYQPYADEDGHGDTWRRMTTERTKHASFDAFSKAYPFSREAGYAAIAAFATANGVKAEKMAIEQITRAMEVQP